MARWLTTCLLFLAVLVGASTATGDPGDEKAQIDAEIGQLKDEVAEKDETAGVLTEELSEVAGEVRSLEAGVAGQEARLRVLEAQLASARAELARHEEKLALQTKRLARLRAEYRKAMDRLEAHVRAAYISGDPELIEVALGATSFDELLDRVELVGRLGRQDQEIASGVADARDEMFVARRETRIARDAAADAERVVAGSTAEQRGLVARLVASRNALEAAQTKRRSTLASIKEDKEDLLHEIEALAEESAALAATIRAAQASAPTGGGGPTSVPVTSTGVLSWPVSGPVTSGFGWRWGRMHEGIDIAVPEGTPVGASGAGTVIYVGWLGGYGNLVVVDHGGGLSTAYAHNSSFAVSQGQSVSTGSVIAYSGNTGNSSGPHVHFEVRVNGSAVDPLGYL